MKLKTIILPPASRLEEVCSRSGRQLLEERFHPIWNETGRDYTESELLELISDADAVISSWGSPSITEAMLLEAKNLRMIGHAAGSIKHRTPVSVFSREIKIFSAAPRIARIVGEYCMAALFSQLRKLQAFDQLIREGRWKNHGMRGCELAGQTIGIISASSTAREFIRLLKPFQLQVLIYDPYLSDESASSLGARRATLEEVMSSPIISIHAPALPATENMITRQLIQRIPDGAILINSSRGTVLDEEALIAELQTGRFSAVLDVLHKEPIVDNHPFLKMDNVTLTPHIAGNSLQGRQALMGEIAQDMLDSLEHRATKYEVTQRMWEVMA